MSEKGEAGTKHVDVDSCFVNYARCVLEGGHAGRDCVDQQSQLLDTAVTLKEGSCGAFVESLQASPLWPGY